MGTPPFVPQDTFGASQGSTNAIPGAATDASRMAMQIIQQATQGAQNPIVSRPQVILPQPRVPQKLPTDTPPTGMVNATTRAGQRRNDMQSLISSVGNIVRAGINKKNQNVERDVMHDLAIIQAAASNPDDPQNKAILDKMSQDSKVVKRLEKALGHNPLSGEPPPTEAKAMMKFQASQQPRQQAVQAAQGRSAIQNNPALQGGGQGNGSSGGQPTLTPIPNAVPGQNTPQPIPNAQGANVTPQGGGAMQNLFSRMPNTQQINPVVAMQAELIKAGILPKNDLSPKVLLDYVQEAMKDDTKREEIKARAEATNNQSLMRLYDTLVRANASIQRGRERDASQERQTHEKAQAYKYGADKRYAAAESKAMKTDSTFKNLKIASDAYDKDIQRTEEQLSTLLKQKTTGQIEKGQDIDQAIILKKQELDKYKSLKDTMTNMMKERLQIDPPEGGVDNLLQQDTPKEEDMQFGDYVFGNQPQQ